MGFRIAGGVRLTPVVVVLLSCSGRAAFFRAFFRVQQQIQRGFMSAAGQPDTKEQLRFHLQKWWGYGDFRQLQLESMQLVMERRDSLTVLPTGGGKSLCYQVPAMAREGLAIVVSPLISLMKDQVDALTNNGVPAAFINSAQTAAEKRQVARQIRRGDLKLLYISPERLLQPFTLDFLRGVQLSFVAIDEAHCISQWGHDFRPEYRQLSTLRQEFPGISVHGYTATATEKVREDIISQMGLESAEVLVGSFDRPNLLYRVERRVEVIPQIRQILDRHKRESGIVYCISRKKVESTSEALNKLGFKTLPYHAGLSDEERRLSQEAFIAEKVQIIVATVAFGMGIDKSNVRFVIHAEMPKSLEHYQQESGRAGRDGLHAECTMLYSAGDAETWKYLMQDVTDESVRASAEQSLRSMQRYCSSMRCRHQMLVEHFGQTLQQERCGACDVCLQEMTATADALIVSQKILSCVIRLGEKFGAAYTAQVLRGSKVKRIVENRHDQLSTWGLMKDVSETQVRHWIDQLISLGHLRQAGEYLCLQVTTTGRQVLRGELTPELLCIRTSEAPEQADDSWAGVDRGLFEELRGLRTRLAIQRGVPPYIIFSDATLRALARHRPVSAITLQQVPGIGAKKLQELGNTVLEEIRRWCAANRATGDVGFGASPGSLPPAALTPSPRRVELADDYLQLFEEQLSMEEIAVQLDRTLDTVSRYLAQYVETRRIPDIDAWVDPAVQRRVEQSIGRLGAEKLKPLFEDLGGAVPYHELRIVAVAWTIRQSESEE